MKKLILIATAIIALSSVFLATAAISDRLCRNNNNTGLVCKSPGVRTLVISTGDNRSVTNYIHTHKNILKTAYYRIKQVDMDGQFGYRLIRLVRPAHINQPLVKLF